MHHRSRSRLVMQFLSIIVIVTLVVPPGLAIAAPPIGQPQSSGPAPTSVSAPTATVSAWLSHIVRSARELLAEIQPTPTDSPLPSATAEIEPEETVTPSSPPTPVEQIITTLPEKGGSVALGSGRVEIRIPEGSLRESADVELSLFSPEGLDSDAKQVEPLVLFMLRLRKTDREEAVDKVARPIEAIVSIPRDVVELVNAGDKEVRLFRYAGDESKGFYIPSEQTLDAETGKLTATVELSDDAETTFGVMTTSSDDAPRGWILSWREPAVSEFSGAATYVYPIALPPARGNHQPNIDISYSSRDLDGRTKAAVDMNQGEIGVGWTGWFILRVN